MTETTTKIETLRSRENELIAKLILANIELNYFEIGFYEALLANIRREIKEYFSTQEMKAEFY